MRIWRKLDVAAIFTAVIMFGGAGVLAFDTLRGNAKDNELGFGSPNRVLTAPAISPVQAVAGRQARVELKFNVGSGYHVNSNSPHASFLIPTTVTLRPAANVKLEKIVYPAGHDITLAFDPTDKLNVYSGDFTIVATLHVPKSITPGSYPVGGEIRYQACNNNSCFPPRQLPLYFEVLVANGKKK